jgi:hypothetical protein
MPSRRSLLGTLGCLSTPLVAGCQSTTSSTTTTNSSTATTTPKTTFAERSAEPNTDCVDEYESLDPYWQAVGAGPRDGFRLTASDHRVPLGDDVTFALRNVSDELRETGVSKKLDVQRRGDEGWRTIFGIERGTAGIIDKAVPHDPGEGFTWSVTFSERGLTDAFDYNPTFHVCGDLEPGSYRFVYWGVSRDAAHAVPFEVTRP